MVLPVQFDGPQFPLSVIKKQNKTKIKIKVDGYEADLGNTGKILSPAPQKLMQFPNKKLAI